MLLLSVESLTDAAEHWCCYQLACTEIRKQKEIEFDILHADIQGWEGEVCHIVILHVIRGLSKMWEEKHPSLSAINLCFGSKAITLKCCTSWNQYCLMNWTRNSAKLTDPCGSYAFHCSPFTHVCHLLPTSNIDILVYYLFLDTSEQREWKLWIQFSFMTLPVHGTQANNPIKLISPETRFHAIHFWCWQYIRKGKGIPYWN